MSIIKAWYGIDDQFHISVKINDTEYAVCGSEGVDTKMLVHTLQDMVCYAELGFDSGSLFNKAFNATMVKLESENVAD